MKPPSGRAAPRPLAMIFVVGPVCGMRGLRYRVGSHRGSIGGQHCKRSGQLAENQHRTWRWTRAAIWSGRMVALTRRGLVNAVVTSLSCHDANCVFWRVDRRHGRASIRGHCGFTATYLAPWPRGLLVDPRRRIICASCGRNVSSDGRVPPSIAMAAFGISSWGRKRMWIERGNR